MKKIFARFEELHMSQIKLSRRTGIATSTISGWRKKQINPQVDKLVAICKALDMSHIELLCDDENDAERMAMDRFIDEKYVLELLKTSDYDSKIRLSDILKVKNYTYTIFWI